MIFRLRAYTIPAGNLANLHAALAVRIIGNQLADDTPQLLAHLAVALPRRALLILGRWCSRQLRLDRHLNHRLDNRHTLFGGMSRHHRSLFHGQRRGMLFRNLRHRFHRNLAIVGLQALCCQYHRHFIRRLDYHLRGSFPHPFLFQCLIAEQAGKLRQRHRFFCGIDHRFNLCF